MLQDLANGDSECILCVHSFYMLKAKAWETYEISNGKKVEKTFNLKSTAKTYTHTPITLRFFVVQMGNEFA